MIETEVLTVAQRQRAEALLVAREVLSARTAAGPFSSSGVTPPTDHFALITVAEFIVGEKFDAGCSPECAKEHD